MSECRENVSCGVVDFFFAFAVSHLATHGNDELTDASINHRIIETRNEASTDHRIRNEAQPSIDYPGIETKRQPITEVLY